MEPPEILASVALYTVAWSLRDQRPMFIYQITLAEVVLPHRP